MAMFPRRIAVSTHGQGTQGQAAAPSITDPWVTLDGRLNAPAGTAQYPNLLDTYNTGFGGGVNGRYRAVNGSYQISDSGRRQAPWMVAGVDYPVGIDRSLYPTDSTLNNPAAPDPSKNNHMSTIPAGTVLNGGGPFFFNDLFVLAGSGTVTIDGWDFSFSGPSGGMALVVSSFFTGTLIITNNKFQGPPITTSPRYPMTRFSDNSQATFIIRYNNLDGNQASDTNAAGDPAAGQGSPMGFAGGNITVEYNWIYQWSGHCTTGAAKTITTQTMVWRYNLHDRGNYDPPSGVHCEVFQTVGGWQNLTFSVNTVYQPDGDTATGRPGILSSGFYSVGNNPNGPLVNTECSYCTVVGQGLHHAGDTASVAGVTSHTGSNIIDGFSNTSALLVDGRGSLVGQNVFGTGIPAGTTIITTGTTSTQIAMSNNITGAGTTLTVSSWFGHTAIGSGILVGTPGTSFSTGSTHGNTTVDGLSLAPGVPGLTSQDGSLNGLLVFSSSGDIPASPPYPGTTIVSNNGNLTPGSGSITLSAAATGSNAGQTIRALSPYPNSNPRVINNFFDLGPTDSLGNPTWANTPIAAESYPVGSPYFNMPTGYTINTNIKMVDGSSYPTNP